MQANRKLLQRIQNQLTYKIVNFHIMQRNGFIEGSIKMHGQPIHGKMNRVEKLYANTKEHIVKQYRNYSVDDVIITGFQEYS